MLRQKIQSDQINALKSGDKKTLEVLRYILAQIKNKEVDKKSELTDEETLAVLQKHVKTLKESIEAFQKGSRQDLATQYQEEVDIISTYLPQQLTDEELKQAIQTIIENNKEMYEKNPKMIIGLCMKELKSKAESARIMAVLNEVQTA